MRIIQTFWSGNSPNIIENSFGWYAPEYHIMSWAFSCLQLRKFYDDVILYTDKKGHDLLINHLKLPYTEVIVTLDELNNEDPDLWALSKIYTYSKQNKPFLHVDGDVFIWESFEEELLNSNLIAQNKEKGTTNFYKRMFNDIESKLLYIPEEINSISSQENEIFAYNAGIFGGSNTNFFKKYTSLCFEFLEKNKTILNQIDKGSLNVYFEQFFFFCLTQKEGQNVNTLFKEVIPDNEYRGMGDFHLTPTIKKYLHLIGPFKKDFKSCRKMLWAFRETYPEYYEKIINLFPEKYPNELQINSLNGASSNSSIAEINENQYYHRTKSLYKEITGKTADIKKIENSTEVLNNIHLKDLYSYEKKVFEFVQDIIKIYNSKLLNIELQSLKSYDFFKTEYHDSLNMNISINPLVKMITSQWVWIDENNFISLKNNLEIPSEESYVLLIGELENPKYSEFRVDELDLLIIRSIENTSLTVFEMLEKIKAFFDPKDLESSIESFNQLIRGRIENLIFHKCVNIT